VETIRKIKRVSREISQKLSITGPFNIQFLARDNDIKVIECNLRASRSFPFVSKVLKINFIDIATRVMLGLPFTKPDKSMFDIDYIGIKAPQFSFSRLQKADPVLGVDMASTGEVGCIGDSYYEAILKAMLSVGYRIPGKNIMISSGPTKSKTILLESCRQLHEKDFNIFATPGTAQFLSDNGIPSAVLHWPDENADPNVLEYLRNRKLDLVVNIPKNLSKSELDNDYTIRRASVDFNIPLITNPNLAAAFIMAFCKIKPGEMEIKSWNEY
jgi:carbamoyl-phosphate synthase large subunit